MPAPYRAIVFDLDGVLIDTEPIYLRTINEVLTEAGVAPLSEKDNRPFLGKSAGYTWQAIQSLYDLPLTAAEYQARYDELLPAVLERDLALRPDASRLLKRVSDRKLPRGLATSSRRKWVAYKLCLLKLDNYFGSVVCGDDVEKSKPAPDIYLRAIEGLRVGAKEAVAIEDSPTGVAAAVAAGLYTIALRTEATREVNIDHAHKVIDSLDELDIDMFQTRQESSVR